MAIIVRLQTCNELCAEHVLSLSEILPLGICAASEIKALGCQMGCILVPGVHGRIYTCFTSHKPSSWHILPVFHWLILLSLQLAALFKNN